MRKSLLVVLFFLATLLPASAQFYLNGDDPGHLKWYSVETPFYQVIYPQGADSLARVYARRLEQYRVPIGRSIGTTPGVGLGRKMPVVLHAYYPYSNGSMGWAPIRMDLYPHPEPYGSDPVPWEIQLAAHEPRHQAQMQAQGKRGWQRLLTYVMGEGWNPVGWQLYMDFVFGEGDAVVAETGLAAGTRARTTDFLNYYRVSLDQGDYRNWERWRYGSYRLYTPNHYALGYVTLAGAREFTQNPLLMQEALKASIKNPLLIAPYNFRKVLRKHTQEPFNVTFRRILDSLNTRWQADAEARGPFMPMEQLTPATSFYTQYDSPQVLNGKLYAIRSGNLYPSQLVTVSPDGQVETVRPFASHTSDIFADPNKGRLYWSETRPDGRWSLAGTSVICYLDAETGAVRDLTQGTRLYNPQPSPDGAFLAAADYPVSGGTAVVVLDAENGQTLRRIPAPDGIQVTELAWLDGSIFLTSISLDGCGIYCIGPDDSWTNVLAPTVQKVTDMGSQDHCLEWMSDRTGVSELYRYFPTENKLQQVTASRYGVGSPFQDDEYLYFVSTTRDGELLFRTPVSALQPREVAFSEVYAYPQEALLAKQEKELGGGPDLDSVVPVSAPKRFRKTGNTRIHTWAPLYLNYDDIKAGSMDFSYQTAALGLSGFYQNSLGTLSGMVGYSLHKDPDTDANWRNAVHGKLVYSGWFPVIEASLDLGDRASRHYHLFDVSAPDGLAHYTFLNRRSTPYITGSILAYVPLSYRKNGLLYGVTPQLRYSIGNDWFAKSPIQFTIPEGAKGIYSLGRITDTGQPGSVLLQHFKASVRGYLMLARGSAQPYPSWGIGAEAGIGLRPWLSDIFVPNLYAYAYGYVPGFARTQGLRLTALYQQQLWSPNACFPEMTANTLPRGFDGDASYYVGKAFRRQSKFTADYAINFTLGDLSIPFVAYITHFTATPHADFTLLSAQDNLWSAGLDLTASLGRMLVFPFGGSIGVSFSYLGGSWYQNTEQGKPYSVSMIFDMDLLSSGRSAQSRRR